MSKYVIKVENLSKQYRLGQVSTGTISHDINRWWHRARGKEDPYLKIGETNDRTRKGASDYVWALRDVNFEVEQGEVLGIIGRNGAGKSTLLKILSRTTAPTKGAVKIKGRVASLLEVGTGFHPELSGRENIYLNGAILGMTKNEITRKFDEIVDFAGVERYIETPVKRYSSGMYVRLAFAVAAHLEPEILIVDEVLAVGDAEFQNKALGKMKDISGNHGRTVLFVSHNLQAISSLTNQSILMQHGSIQHLGKTQDVIQQYFRSTVKKPLNFSSDTTYSDKPTITLANVETSHPNNIQQINAPMSVQITVNTPIPIKGAALSYQIFNSKNEAVLHILNLTSENSFCTKPGTYILKSRIPKLRLYPDTYHIAVHFADSFSKVKFLSIDYACSFEVKILGEVRDYYWGSGNAVYLEDNYWIVESAQKI